MITKCIDVESCIAMVKRLIILGMKEDKALHLVSTSYSNVVSYKTLHKLFHKELLQ